MINNGIFTISLDFELYWGIRDKRSLIPWQTRLGRIKDIVHHMLGLFKDYHIHATWACVGFMFFENQSELKEHLPVIKPEYQNKNLSPYPYIDQTDLDSYHDMHFAPNLIRDIIKSPGQEIASHTFSHYYCREQGQTVQQFEQDILTALETAKRMGVDIKSLVFPRNQINMEYIPVLGKHGITAYRDNPEHWMYKSRTHDQLDILRRILRLLDSQFNISGYNSVPYCGSKPPRKLAYSFYLRPITRHSTFTRRLQLHRLTAAMRYASVHNRIFHLWWHPHNFTRDPELNLNYLENILKAFQQLSQKNGMQSLNMHEISKNIESQ